MQPIYEFGGAGPVLHLAVANGFPPQVYEPLLKPLSAHYQVVSLPPRALWPGEQPPDQPEDWRAIAADLLAGLHTYNLTDVIAIGHSFGGIASILAALAEPGRFRGLCLLDPTILLPHFMQAMAAAQADGSVNEFPLSQGAQRRRRQFADVEDAYVYFRGKPLFKDWPDDMVRLYASGGTRPSPNGGGIELIWPPEWEAYYFRTLYTRTWDDLPRLNGLLPTLVIRGADSDTFVTEAAEQAQTLLPAAAFVDIAGHGHLFPQSAPDETRRILGDWLMQIEGKR